MRIVRVCDHNNNIVLFKKETFLKQKYRNITDISAIVYNYKEIKLILLLYDYTIPIYNINA